MTSPTRRPPSTDEEALQRWKNALTASRLKRKMARPWTNVLAARPHRMRQRLAKIMAAPISSWLCMNANSNARGAQRRLRTAQRQRKTAAGPLAKAIARKLQNLGFAKAEFAIQLKAANPGPTGADAVEFAIAPNVGEAMQPLRAIASSGEMARVMLAVKTVLSDADNVPILIFDEIDANVGGRIAVTVAAELAAVSRRHQVFSITHLPDRSGRRPSNFLVGQARPPTNAQPLSCISSTRKNAAPNWSECSALNSTPKLPPPMPTNCSAKRVLAPDPKAGPKQC